MFRTRSPPCAAASSPPSSKRCRDAYAAQRRSSDDHDRKICDAVRLVVREEIRMPSAKGLIGGFGVWGFAGFWGLAGGFLAKCAGGIPANRGL
jgi:hypothetical protein